jgi:CubicO group peptidase (beta-lactamase class C family)
MRICHRFAIIGVASLVGAAAATWIVRSASASSTTGAASTAGRGPSRQIVLSAPPEQPTEAAPVAAPRPPAREILNRSLDAFVEEQMRKFDLPGAAVVVVHGGEVVHIRGYGHADAETGRRFDPELSVFRTASVSKLFTATAVMQLVEQGRIDLDADVERYLDFRLPATYPQPITMRHLLTHTAGFDERLIGSAASQPRKDAALTPRQFLTSRDAAPRVRPPGQVISYSNYGMALAGYVVERVSGTPFARYVDEHIHAPLGMRRSTFAEPLPAALEDGRVQAHLFAKGRHQVLPTTFQSDAPAGSQFSTGADLARFMLANLQGGELDGSRVLGIDALRQMHAQSFTHHPALPGWTLGFSEYHHRGHRMIGHGGDLPGYHNQLTLAPDEGLGVFVHFNGMWPITIDDDPRARVVEHVVAALLPPIAGGESGDGAVSTPGVGSVSPLTAFRRADDATRLHVAGNYRFTRHPVTSIQKLLVPNSFFRLHVREGAGGTVRMTMPLGFAAPSEWELVEPLLYRRVGGDDYLAFGRDEQGRVTHLFPTLMIPLAFERVRWYESEAFLLGLLGFSALAFVGTALAWPAGALARRIRPGASHAPPPSSGQRRRRVAARAVAVLGTSVIATLGVMFVQANTAGDTPLLPLQPVLAAAAGACGLIAVALGYSTARAWRTGEGRLAERVAHTAVALGGMAFLWQVTYWKVFPF